MAKTTVKSITEEVIAFSSVKDEQTVVHKDFTVNNNGRNKKLFYKDQLIALVSNVGTQVRGSLFPFDRKHVPIIKDFFNQNGFSIPTTATQDKLYKMFLAAHLTDPANVVQHTD